MRKFLCSLAFVTTGLVSTMPAFAAEAGWRHLDLNTDPAQAALQVALYYPTSVAPRTTEMGPFQVHAAIGAPAAAQFKGMIVLSHGLSGSELGHSSLAEALARSGYLVAALQHPGDNWQDHSLMEKTPALYFIKRPLALSRVIDAILARPEWAGRIARDDKGPKIGALGHSAGGFSVIALAGGRADPRQVLEHCASDTAQDPVFCHTGQIAQETVDRFTAAAEAAGAAPGSSDPRVRAVVAMAPVGVPFTSASLAAVTTPTLIYEAEQDRWLVPRFHAERLAAEIPHAQLRRIANATHFAFMDTPSMSIASPDGDIRNDLPGFDRKEFLRQLASDIPAWFDKTLQ